ITQNTAHADNVLMIINKIVKAQLRFKNDLNNPLETNDNRYLEFGWFLTAAARGVNIVNQSMSEQWKTEHKWNDALHDFNDWIGEGINQNWDIKYALKQSPLNIVSQTGTMNWVGTIDTQFGATNRSFAMLEAQFRIAELRGGKLGPVILIPNAWQKKQQFPKQHDGSIAVLFETFRGYLKYYFNKPISNNPKEFVLKSDPSHVVLNNNPEKPDELPCGDPLKLGYRALCGLNKDAYRNDTYHPQMGLASVLHIIELGKRYGLELTDDEHQRVIKGLRWASFNNVDGVTAASAHGIPVWELAFRLYSADELGPYCQRDLLANRSQDEFKKAALAWGYTELTGGY
ncbi:MAG: hypothetical protein NTX25_16900, partial [Proteobacteria bacterium]|nr:hypothetical protein [Pseudomonadota bacterium]